MGLFISFLITGGISSKIKFDYKLEGGMYIILLSKFGGRLSLSIKSSFRQFLSILHKQVTYI